MQRTNPSRLQTGLRRLRLDWVLYALLLPTLVYFVIFRVIPIWNMRLAFYNFSGRSAWTWAGLKYFEMMFGSPLMKDILLNTLIISLMKYVLLFPFFPLFAILLSEMRLGRLRKFTQVVSYLPHFISWVVCATLMFDLMSTDGGAINEFLMWIGVIKEPIGFFTEGKYFWGITLCTDIWKELGWNAIIFISAITSISQDMYEAADIDGATRAQKMWHITIKSIKPTIILMFIFQVGGILNANFDQIMMLTKQMGNSMLKEYADVLDTFIYRLGVSQGRFSFAAAAGLFKSIVNFALLLGSNYVAGKFGEAQLF